ncbi:MAG TPA: class I SAM-dependent methyltransferase, partial [Ferroplasma sp.]|nr:class I SAM-dependent methyltransferase [Ferroplasma sp.]
MNLDDKYKRVLFDTIAEIYDLVRPQYPRSLIDDLEEASDLQRRSRILEIGSGTGQLTKGLAARGFNIDCVEIGPNLAGVATTRLSEFPNIRIKIGNFEKMKYKANYYDLAVFATSYKWIDPNERIPRVTRLLRENGYIAIIETHHVNGGTENFFIDSQTCYKRYDSNTPDTFQLPDPTGVVARKYEEEMKKYFNTVISRFYEQEVQYSTAEYQKLLRTYSDVLAMDEESRKALLDCIAEIIESKYAGY